ncbi:zinc finger matrin-type protein 1 isoform X1 [Etheostoma cragini]|uniref:zinc finger matrin-type protein 1 isoform X1 n=2 Tax=Etheostoma cragini TaxID=417921 RepID=UPI00155F1F43|nr:zinc finger matrin-type protein 1 isoform X1 [Etheostoma cragini]
MDGRSVCTPLLAESDAQNNTTSTPNAASVTDADKVINTKIDSTQVKGATSEEELLKALLTNDYCHVCEAVLLFESQRVSHYEGKKHAQRLKVYLQAKRGEKMNKESTAPQRTMTTDEDHFCELCNMVFSSHVVAKSHYEGKVHAKNLRKQGIQPPVTDRYTEVRTLPSLTRDPEDADQKSAPKGSMEHLLEPAATTTTPSTEVDLKDPNKYCALCAASFNNPQMALQHYNGRKHQRNQARQELLKELSDDVQQAKSLMCKICSVQFNSVEMYQAHVHGNKHQIREKKVVDLCKSQQKDYNTFADELADYIQVQKVRGIIPKGSQVLTLGDTQKEDDEEEEEEALNKGDSIELNKTMPNLPPTSHPCHQPRPGCYYTAEGWRPPYQGPAWPPRAWDYNCPAPVLPGSDSPLFTSRPTKRKRHRKQSSSSSYTSSSSSYSSSYSSSTSDSEESEYRRRGKRRIRRSRRERNRRPRHDDSDKEEKKRKRQRRERDNDSEERRGEESGESEQESRRKKQKNHGERRRRENKSREEDSAADGGEGVMDNLVPEDTMGNRKDTDVHIQAVMNVEQGEDGLDKPAKPKYRKEKKKTKEKVDNRTEEEKLWDDSILGC